MYIAFRPIISITNMIMKDSLMKIRMSLVTFFLNMFKHLNGEGIEEWDKFNEKRGIFKLLMEKDIENTIVFWRMARTECPKMSKLSLKLLNVPASSAQLERFFFFQIGRKFTPQ
jgi:hypothetical protein